MTVHTPVTFVTGDVPDFWAPNGFQQRAAHFASALASRGKLALYVWESECCEASAESPTWPANSGIALRPVLRCTEPLGTGMQSRVRWFRQQFVGRLPAWSRPRRCSQLNADLASAGGTLCIHLPYFAHLATRAPKNIRVVAILEETLERALWPPDIQRPHHRLARWVQLRRIHAEYRRVGRRASHVVVISTDERDQFVSIGIDQSKLRVVPHGIDLRHYASTRAATRGPARAILIVGDFTHARNLKPTEWLVREFASRRREFQVSVVGKIRAADAATLAAMGARVTGQVDDVRRHYDANDIVIVPAHSGTGVKTTLLQAWAMSVPAVATIEATRGTRAEDGVHLLVARTLDEVLQLCDRLTLSEHLRSELARRGRALVTEDHDIHRISQAFAELVLPA